MMATWRSASTLVWTYCFMVNAISDINVVRSQGDQLAEPGPRRPLAGKTEQSRRVRRPPGRRNGCS